MPQRLFNPNTKPVTITSRGEVRPLSVFKKNKSNGYVSIEVPTVQFARQAIGNFSLLINHALIEDNTIAFGGIDVKFRLEEGASAIVRFTTDRRNWYEVYLLKISQKFPYTFEEYCSEERNKIDVREREIPLSLTLPIIINGKNIIENKSKIYFQFALEEFTNTDKPSKIEFFNLHALAQINVVDDGGGDPVSATTNPPSGPQRGG
jgi:hypothetical protein